MPTPVQSNDRRYINAGCESHVIVDDPKKLDLEGPDIHQVVQAQKDAVLPEGLEHLGTQALTRAAQEGATKLAAAALKRGSRIALGWLATAAAPASAAVTLTELLIDADKEGAAQRHAYERDSVTLAAVKVGAGALPAGFIYHMRKELADSHGGGQRIVNDLMERHGEEAWKSVMASTQHLIRQGQAQAKKLGIHDEKTLEAKLANKKSNFAAAYHKSVALRVGVQSAIWSAQHPGH